MELKVIVVAKQAVFRTKKGEIAQFLVADDTGCGYINLFNEIGRQVEEGDILYLSGIYTSHFKEALLIYQGTSSIIRRIGKWYPYAHLGISNSI